MKIFTAEQVRKIDEYTIKNEPIPSSELMERAGSTFVKKFMYNYDSSRKVLVFAGPGNNGGDGLAVARMLGERFYQVRVFILMFGRGSSEDFALNKKRLSNTSVAVHEIKDVSEIPEIEENTVIIDAIFGSGLTRPVQGFPAEVIKAVNQSGAEVVSIDIPSGLFGEDNTGNNGEAVIRAKLTISFEFPFLSFFFPENASFVGRWIAPSIGLHPEAIQETKATHSLISRQMVSGLLKKRSRFAHKGSFGHALVIAGCDGMTGAAILAVRAALRTGAGLVTAHVPRNTYPIIQTTAPEALISIDQSDIIFTDLPDLRAYTAIAAGPGLNCRKNTGNGIEKLLKESHVPMVLDADALNILSSHPEWIGLLPENTIITPHPKEFDRLFGASENMYSRHQKQIQNSKKYKIIIVLKGAHTMITLPDGFTWINNTGNPGMATGGSGDVLTGMIVSLLAQAYSSENAAVMAVFLHGLAADLALDNQSYESLIPGDIIENLGRAFKIICEDDKS